MTADLLRREVAPLTSEAWKQLDETAARILKTLLTARTLVDFHGPYGWEFAAVNLGRLALAPRLGPQELTWGTRQVQPLIEVRAAFTLPQMELDIISRGAKDVDFGPLEEVARRIASFEDTVLYRGFSDGGIRGMLERSEHKAMALPGAGDEYPAAVARAVEALKRKGIPGPYSLVLGSGPFLTLMESIQPGCLPHRIVQELIGGKILMSTALDGGVLLSTAPDNFEMTVGQDLSIGYASHNRESVELFLTESFTFRVLEPAAAIELRSEK